MAPSRLELRHGLTVLQQTELSEYCGGMKDRTDPV